MSSRYRLVLLVGLVGLGAAIVAIVALAWADNGPDASADARAYLAAWQNGDYAAMRERVADPPDSFDTVHQRIVDNLHVTRSSYRLGSVDTSGDNAIAHYTANLQLAGLGEWSYRGALSFRRSNGRWLVDWTPAAIHPKLGRGQTLTRTRDVPERAPILDQAGNPLAATGPGRIVGVEPRAIKNLAQVKAALRQYLGVEPADVDKALHAPGVEPNHFVPIITISQQRYNQVAPVIYPLPGTRFRDATLRVTPSPGFARHVLGRTGEITAELLDKLGPPYQVGDVVGLTGLEARFEAQLAGTPSGDIQLTGGDGKVVETIGHIKGRAPRPLRTTLDRAAQSAVESALAGVDKPAAIVVVDRDGNVRAAASRPLDDGFDRALAGKYPPGSTMKVVTTAALLAHGVTPATPVDCPPTVNAGGRVFKNFESGSLGTVPFRQAFADSCNTAFINASAELSDGDLVAAAERFGFNTDYSVGLTTFGGSYPKPADATEHAAESIGQGRVEASPLQMATVAAAVIDGTWEAPVLLPDTPPVGSTETTSTTEAAGGTGSTETTDGATESATRPPPTQLATDKARTLFGLMRRVVTEGTGRAAAISGVEIAGKTGTAEFGSGNPPSTHAWFLGIRGDNAVAVLVEGGGVGGKVAAPIAGKVLAALPGG